MSDLTYPVLDNTVSKRLVDMGDDTHAEQVLSHPPFDLMTDSNGTGAHRRIRVDNGSTGWWSGHTFYNFYEFSVAVGSSVIIKAVVGCDIIQNYMSVNLRSGEVKIYPVTGGTEGGTFGTSLESLPANSMSDTPAYTSQVVVTTGGTLTDGTATDETWLYVGQNSIQATPVGGGIEDARGISAGTYYYRIYGVAASTGVIRSQWEERPDGV